MMTLKRVYEPAGPEDGLRVLVDRRWPRALNKATAAIDRWEKQVAPSAELHPWFGGRRAVTAQRKDRRKNVSDRPRKRKIVSASALIGYSACIASVDSGPLWRAAGTENLKTSSARTCALLRQT
jgi:Protein of unknown function, DUF488